LIQSLIEEEYFQYLKGRKMKPNSLLILAVMGSVALIEFQPSSISAVSLIGGVIKARHEITEEAKYPRNECPVCKGKGWYISGDGIEKVECGYCEPAKEEPKEPETNQQTDTVEPKLVPIKTFFLD
jgi:hypothetical protein